MELRHAWKLCFKTVWFDCTDHKYIDEEFDKVEITILRLIYFGIID